MTKSEQGTSGQPVPSPCIRQCCLDQEDICLGCGRTLEEILHWSSSSPSEKMEVLNRAKERKQSR